MWESLRAIRQALTRYSANAPELPVNSSASFTDDGVKIAN
jgi:hypothetical protein